MKNSAEEKNSLESQNRNSNKPLKGPSFRFSRKLELEIEPWKIV